MNTPQNPPNVSIELLSQSATSSPRRQSQCIPRERPMSRQALIDSLPVGPQVTDGKDPMRDLPIHARPIRPILPVTKADNEDERQLLRAFGRWIKHPTKPDALEALSHLMVAHEIRAYTGLKRAAKNPSIK